MRILIIASQVGKTAPGIVFERLIKGLSLHYEIDVITSNYSPNINLDGLKKVSVIPLGLGNKYRAIERILTGFFNINIIDIIWSYRAKNRCFTQYELIFSFSSFHNLYSLIAGSKIASKQKIKHFAYFVDAIPSPNGWIPVNGYYRAVENIVSKHLSQVDGFFSANHKMLNYQLTTFTHKNNLRTGVIYNPSNSIITDKYEKKTKANYIFLYTGGIYGLRTPFYLIEAFKEVLKEYPNSILMFVGTKLSEKYLENCTDNVRKQILIYPFTRDLSKFYNEATALIDIDANIDNDVFLSSKITNYIFVDRIIISITGKNSPSREIFRNVPSIYQTNHNVDEIVWAMKSTIKESVNVDFNDRKGIQKKFSLESVVESIRHYIDNLDEK